MTDTNVDLVGKVAGDNKPTDTGATMQQSQDEFLGQLVGEGKKFRTADELAKGKLEADRFVSQLEMENKELRKAVAELEKQKIREQTATELLNEVRKASQVPEGNQSQIDLGSISKMVDQTLTEREQNSLKRANRDKVNQVLREKFNGDSEAAVAYVRAQAQELGLNTDAVVRISEQSPQAFIKLIGLASNENDTNVPRNTGNFKTPVGKTNTQSLPNLNGERNFAYYEKLKKEMGFNKYFQDLKLQNQKMKDMDALGDRFFATTN